MDQICRCNNNQLLHGGCICGAVVPWEQRGLVAAPAAVKAAPEQLFTLKSFLESVPYGLGQNGLKLLWDGEGQFEPGVYSVTRAETDQGPNVLFEAETLCEGIVIYIQSKSSGPHWRALNPSVAV